MRVDHAGSRSGPWLDGTRKLRCPAVDLFRGRGLAAVEAEKLRIEEGEGEWGGGRKEQSGERV